MAENIRPATLGAKSRIPTVSSDKLMRGGSIYEKQREAVIQRYFSEADRKYLEPCMILDATFLLTNQHVSLTSKKCHLDHASENKR